jgi:16S rRNA (guanine966-N2)-methyltransferase
MRIVAGAWRGRALVAPAGQSTRPTADRVRQALFDMLMHAPWAGREVLGGAHVLDAFAGTGGLGLEALSRGAAHATFIENDRAALAALRANIAACRAEARCDVYPGDALRPLPGPGPHGPCRVVFLDPPYGRDLIPRAVQALHQAGWLAPGTLLIVETARDEMLTPLGEFLAERLHGAARLSIWRQDQA